MPLCMLRYAFNFSLNLPDDLTFRVTKDDQEVFIRCLRLDGDEIFSFTRDHYNWLLKNDSIQESLIYSFNKKGDKYLARKVRFFENNILFSGGVIDPVKYSICEVVFRVEKLDTLKDEKLLQQTNVWASEFLFYFIDMYRIVSQEGNIPAPSMKETSVVEILVSDDENIEPPYIGASFRKHSFIFHWNDPFNRGLNKGFLSIQKINLLKQAVGGGRPISLYERLLLDSKEQAHIMGNFDLSIILAETAFEVFLQNHITSQCMMQGIKVLPDHNNLDKDFREIIEKSNVKELITKHLKVLTQKNFAETKFYNKWYEQAYQVRNDIVHKGKIGWTKADAEKAFMAVINLIKAIESFTK